MSSRLRHAVAFGILENEGAAKKALPVCNITAITGEEMKKALSGYLNVLFEQIRRQWAASSRTMPLCDDCGKMREGLKPQSRELFRWCFLASFSGE